MMNAEEPRRYRKRGGAKKKKKQNVLNEQSSDPYEPKNSVNVTNNHENFNSVPKNQYAGGFSGRKERLFGEELQSYLEKLVNDLEQLDPGAELATLWAKKANRDDDDIPQSVLLARNSLKELAPHAHELSRDGYAGRILERLLEASNDVDASAELLKAILSCGSKRLLELSLHGCASHVLQKLIGTTAITSYEDSECSKQAMELLSETVSAWTCGDIIEVIYSSAGSHVFRACVAALAGIPVEEPRETKLDDANPQKITNYIENMAVDVPKTNHETVKQLVDKLLQKDTKDLLDIPWTPASSTAVQGLIAAVSVSNRSLAKQAFDSLVSSQFEELIFDTCGSRFIERGLVCLGNLFNKDLMKGKLLSLSRHPKANFCVQRFLLGLKGRGAVMNAWDELEMYISEMLGFGKGREGVVLSLLRVTEAEGDENCRRRATRCIVGASGAKGEKLKELAGILMMGSFDVWQHWRSKVKEIGRSGFGLTGKDTDSLFIPQFLTRPSLLGTLIARCIMRFPGGPGQACRDSMASLANDEIIALIGNPIGSRLIEQWVASDCSEQGGKIAMKVITALGIDQGDGGILASCRNQYAARVLVKCIPRLQSQHRQAVMNILASHYQPLKKHNSAQIVLRKCRVEQFMRRGEDWNQGESKRETRNRLFADILEDQEDEDATTAGNTKGANSQGKKRKRRDQKTSVNLMHIPHAPTSGMRENENTTNDNEGEDEKDVSVILGAIKTAAETSKRERKSKYRRH